MSCLSNIFRVITLRSGHNELLPLSSCRSLWNHLNCILRAQISSRFELDLTNFNKDKVDKMRLIALPGYNWIMFPVFTLNRVAINLQLPYIMWCWLLIVKLVMSENYSGNYRVLRLGLIHTFICESTKFSSYILYVWLFMKLNIWINFFAIVVRKNLK